MKNFIGQTISFEEEKMTKDIPERMTSKIKKKILKLNI
jgi:hypothetical protein